MGEFVLYSYFRSSASFRVRIALGLKECAYDYRGIHLLKLDQLSDDYVKINPSRQVPTLIHDGHAIGQSMAILDYLDHIKPEPRLFPQEPLARARVIQLCEIVNSGIQPLHNSGVHRHLEKTFAADEKIVSDWATHWIREGLDALEKLMTSTAGDFSFGNAVTAADCCLIPQLTAADRFHVSLANHPILRRVRANCEKIEAFQKAMPFVQPDAPAP